MHFVRYSGFYERGGNKEEMNMKIMAKILLEHNLDVASNWRGRVCLFCFFFFQKSFFINMSENSASVHGRGSHSSYQHCIHAPPLMYGSK